MNQTDLSYWFIESGSLVRIVKDRESVKDMLQDLRSIASLSLSLKGERLSANGSISLVTLKAAGLNDLLDIQKLGSDAYFLKLATKSLASMLSFKYVKKAMYDCRNASNALYGNYGLAMKGILDFQRFHLANLPMEECQYLPSLSEALERYPVLSEEWLVAFKEAKTVFASIYVDVRGSSEKSLTNVRSTIRLLRMLQWMCSSWRSSMIVVEYALAQTG